MNRFFFLLFAALGVSTLGVFSQTRAQTVAVTGTVRDGTGSNGPLIGVTVLVLDTPDSTRRTGAVTDTAGRFSLDMAPGDYRLRVSLIGYQPLETPLRVDRTAQDLGVLRLVENAKQLKEVTVVGQQLRVETKGDTLQFNAGAFKTNPDATAEDLVRKLPGITVENGTVKTQGEDVKRVLIDGKPFFGDDPSLALRNLPAEVIDKIQVFDRLSDQSQFSGFDDGNTDKTINIVTRPGRNNGQFGKAYGGVGTDGRYQAGANVNFFNGDRRISLLGLSNNINQQNFATQDLLGALGSGTSGRQGGGGRQRGGGGPGGGGGFRGGGGGPGGGGQGGGGNAGNFLVGQQGGITSTNAFGLNYSDTWGTKATVTGSYFFNDSRNLANTLLNRTYFASRGQTQVYDETEQNSTGNLNHRVNFRLEYKFNPRTSLIVTPSMSWQNTRGFNAFDGENRVSDVLLSRTSSENNTTSRGYNFSNNVLLQRRFAKQGRTISLSVSTSASDRTRDNRLQSLNEFFGTTDSTFRINQESASLTTGYTLGANLSYTEPLGKRGQLQLTYNPSFTDGFTEKNTYNINGKTSLDTLLSNTFASQYVSQRLGSSYRLQGKLWQVSAGVFFQNATLSGDQSFPRTFEVRKTFTNLLPNVQVNFRPTRQQNLRINYRASTNFPSVNQLQNVIDNSNPLQLTTGNPDLKQEYTHQFTARYNRTNPENARSLFFLVAGTLTQANITNTTYLAQRDTVLSNGVVLYTGSQLTRPTNLDGYHSFRSFLTYGLPVSKLKSNLNFNLGYAYTRLPGLVNNVLNLSNTSAFNGGLVLSSNVSETLDFTLSYAGTYNLVRNSIRPQLNSNYFFHAASARVNWLFGKGFLFNSDLTNTLYRGLGEGFDQNFLLWNVSFGKKFLKDRRGELKLTVFDVLRQNNSISRAVTETYVDDTQTQVLRQYAMVTFTYTFRNFIK
jgi:uncharacterized membrane protein YgcG